MYWPYSCLGFKHHSICSCIVWLAKNSLPCFVANMKQWYLHCWCTRVWCATGCRQTGCLHCGYQLSAADLLFKTIFIMSLFHRWCPGWHTVVVCDDLYCNPFLIQWVWCLLCFWHFLVELGMAQRKFAQCLGEFQFEYIGDAKTDDEKCIGKCGLTTSYWRR